MKFAFFATNIVPVHAKTLEERALGGTETGLIRIAEALHRLGHEVTVYTPHENPPDSKPRYLPVRMIEEAKEVDVFVVIRDWIPVFYKIPARRRFLWTGDSYDQFMNFGIGDKRVAASVDALLTVSDWQADSLSEHSGFPRPKCFRLGNGYEPSFFEGSEKKIRKRLIYSSTPIRGLRHIPRLFAEVKKKHPDAECHIFSSYQIYDQSPDQRYEQTMFELRAQPGIEVHGSILQKQLAREFMKSSILFYPCEFQETSCITAMEAMAAGCAIVTSKLAALPETIGDAGVFIEGLPSRGRYDQDFIEATDRLLSDDAFFESLVSKGRLRAQELTWTKVAERFVRFLEALDQRQ